MKQRNAIAFGASPEPMQGGCVKALLGQKGASEEKRGVFECQNPNTESKGSALLKKRHNVHDSKSDMSGLRRRGRQLKTT